MSANSIEVATVAADPDVVVVARKWLLICKEDFNEWPDVTADELAALPAEAVVWVVDRLWAGGLSAFLADSAADIADRRTARATTAI
ncbi:hypothetical protein ACFXG4_30700 [Nocardia sp. NPDC059246]|uniref:hypothetical protein n=1 Tax=unclassified Nocardia TaxID=2637762 RepID=UPI00368F05D9